MRIIEATPETTQDPSKRYRCRHIFIDGHRCGSPSLRGEHLCYYHHTTRGFADEKRHRRTWKEFELPPLEDRSSVLAAISEVLQRIACDNLPTKQAGLLLYGLQIASLNLPETGEAKSDDQDDQPVEEVITNPRYGELAPLAEFVDEAKQEQNRVPHLRDGLIVAKVGEAEQTHPETTKPKPEQPITLSTLQASALHPRSSAPIRGRSLHPPTLPTETEINIPNPAPAAPAWYPDNCHANQKRTPQPPYSAHRHQAAQRRRPRRRHAVDGLQLA